MVTSAFSSTSDLSFLNADCTNVGRSNPLSKMKLEYVDGQIRNKNTNEYRLLCLALTFGASPVMDRYLIPPSSTMPSNGATFKPASTARARVTVKREAGSKFKFKSRVGDCVVDLGADLKSVVVSIVPKEIERFDGR